MDSTVVSTRDKHEAQNRPLAVAPAEAARLLGCGRTTLYFLLGTGALPSFTLGRRRLIRVAALEAWMAAREADQ